MAEGSESVPLMADYSKSSSVTAEDSSNEVSEQSELDVRQYDSSTTESDKGDAAIGGEKHKAEAGSAVDGDNRKELSAEAEFKEDVPLGEASQEDPGHPESIQLLRPNPPHEAIDLAHAAAYTAHTAATSCRNIMDAMEEAIKVGNKRMVAARRTAEAVSEFDEATRYRALANEYDAAIVLATRRTQQIMEAAESAENASAQAETAANEMAAVLGASPSEIEDKLSAVYWAANRANMAAIAATKMEYAAVNTMKKCWKDLNLRNVETAGLPTRNPDDAQCGGTRHEKALLKFCNGASFIFGIIILATVLSYVKVTDNPNTHASLIAVGAILIVMPVFYLLYKILSFCRNKRIEAKQKENKNIIDHIDKRLHELEEYFENNSISPVNSDEEH